MQKTFILTRRCPRDTISGDWCRTLCALILTAGFAFGQSSKISKDLANLARRLEASG
jgi:hypothetical protein